MSPNMKDPAKRTHPVYQTQTETKPRIYRYESWDQLWIDFEKQHQGFAYKLQNSEAPMECPIILRTYVSWKIVKEEDSSCLCVDCEGMNACRRGPKTLIKSMDELKSNIVDINHDLCSPCNPTGSDTTASDNDKRGVPSSCERESDPKREILRERDLEREILRERS